MVEISFVYLEKTAFFEYATRLFAILHTNMTPIAPTGNTYEEAFAYWRDAFGPWFVKHEERKIILIKDKTEVVGFLTYAAKDSTFHIDEIQIAPEYQGKYGIFRKVYAFAVQNLPHGLQFVEAYAHKSNEKSVAILRKQGLELIGMSENKINYRLLGKFEDFLLWLHHKK